MTIFFISDKEVTRRKQNLHMPNDTSLQQPEANLVNKGHQASPNNYIMKAK